MFPRSVVVADLRGRRLVGVERGAIDLRIGALPLDDERLERDRKDWSKRLTHVEATLAPRFVRTTDNEVELGLVVSDYATFRAAAAQFGEYSEAERFAALSTGPQWGFLHSLGVNFTLETSDGYVAFVRRAAHVHAGGLLAPAVAEGSNVEDLIDGRWDPMSTARRGMHEEFALDEVDVAEAVFHTLIAQLGTGALSVLGHIRLRLTADELVERHRTAADEAEVEELYLARRGSAAAEVLESMEPAAWVDWAQPAFTFAMSEPVGTPR